MTSHFSEQLVDVLQWHEVSPGKEFVDGGTFKEATPMFACWTPYSTVSRTRERVVKCAACDNFIDLAEFSKHRRCLVCQLCDTSSLLEYGSSYNQDLAFATNRWGSFHFGLSVPKGCPHAYEDSRGNSVANVVELSDGGGEHLVPKSWKVTYDGTCVTLALHFRRYFYSSSLGNISNKGFFQNIIANVKTGHTYISQIVNGGSHARRVKKLPLDDVTYSRRTNYIDSTLSSDFLEYPMKVMLQRVLDALREHGYDVVYEPASPFGVDSYGSEFYFKQLIEKNRFPQLSEVPYEMYWWQPYSFRRVIADLPRDKGALELMDVLGLPHSAALDKAIAKRPSSLELAYFLMLAGDGDPDSLAFACGHPGYERLRTRLSNYCYNADDKYIASGDLVRLLLPAAARDGWRELYKRELDDDAVGYGRKRRQSSWDIDVNAYAVEAYNDRVRSALKHAAYKLLTAQPLPRASSMVELLNALGQCPSTLYETRPLSSQDLALDDAFKLDRQRWKFVPVVDARGWWVGNGNGRENFDCQAVDCFCDGVEVFHIVLSRPTHIDKRKWSRKVSRAYADAAVSPEDWALSTRTQWAEKLFGCLTPKYSIMACVLTTAGNDVPAHVRERVLSKWCKKRNISFDAKRKPVLFDANGLPCMT